MTPARNTSTAPPRPATWTIRLSRRIELTRDRRRSNRRRLTMVLLAKRERASPTRQLWPSRTQRLISQVFWSNSILAFGNFRKDEGGRMKDESCTACCACRLQLASVRKHDSESTGRACRRDYARILTC